MHSPTMDTVPPRMLTAAEVVSASCSRLCTAHTPHVCIIYYMYVFITSGARRWVAQTVRGGPYQQKGRERERAGQCQCCERAVGVGWAH